MEVQLILVYAVVAVAVLLTIRWFWQAIVRPPYDHGCKGCDHCGSSRALMPKSAGTKKMELGSSSKK